MYNILLIVFMVGMLTEFVMISPVGVYWLISCIDEHKVCYPIIIVFTISPILVIIGTYLGF